MEWLNIGDIDPRSGTTLVRDLEFDGKSFSGEAIEVIPESQVGGSEEVFLIRQGDLFLSEENFSSALQTVGAKLEDGFILRPDHAGDVSQISLRSPEGLLEMANAANAYTSIENGGPGFLVRTGLPTVFDPEARFDGDPVIYRNGTSLWAILRRDADGFQDTPEENPVDAVPFCADTGPFSNMPRTVETRKDLAEIGGFQKLERDEHGNPKPYLNSYSSNGNEWDEASTEVGVETECPSTGMLVQPHKNRWIGPAEIELISMWNELQNYEEAEYSVEPEF